MLQKINDNDINVDSVFAVFISTALWRASYAASRYLLPKKGPEYSCRIITFIHGVVVATLGCSQCSWDVPPFEHPEWPNSYIQSFTLVTSLGFFIHDLAWCLEYQADDKLIIAHHIYGIWAPSRFLFKGYSGAIASCSLGGMELTNPILQVRWFIRTEGMYPSLLFTVVEITFIVAFAIVRILCGTYYLIMALKHANEEWDIIIGGCVINFMSLLFFVKIVKYGLAKYGWLSQYMQYSDN